MEASMTVEYSPVLFTGSSAITLATEHLPWYILARAYGGSLFNSIMPGRSTCSISLVEMPQMLISLLLNIEKRGSLSGF